MESIRARPEIAVNLSFLKVREQVVYFSTIDNQAPRRNIILSGVELEGRVSWLEKGVEGCIVITRDLKPGFSS